MTGEAAEDGSPAAGRAPVEVGALWREHRRWVAAILIAYMPREAELEDLLQEVAVILVSRIGELRDPGALRPWLRTIAINAARMDARARRSRRVRLRPIEDEDGEIALADPACAREQLASDTRAEAEAVMRLARALPEEYREPLLLRSVQGMTQKQIAVTLGLPETTVETRLA
ncbi:MAG TPA: sigma-70 family RNA polymerase sigma factor, partial [Planctomycetota bacterium]|nr:sigma-70 family RNA polymerase sigma factor [Planctomycetota bacterium]